MSRISPRLFWTGLLFSAQFLGAQNTAGQTKAIRERLEQLGLLSDSERAVAARQLALQIRQLPPAASTLSLAEALTNEATQGDLGRDTLQEVTTTLAQALTERRAGRDSYLTLARLVRYEHTHAALDDAQLKAATLQLEDDDRARQRSDFTLPDLNGKSWRLKSLSGKVVLVNFWAPWCLPCRAEIPALGDLYGQFEKSGLVILGVSDDSLSKVRRFAADHKIRYPVLLDKGGKVIERFRVKEIPKSFLYDRQGNLVAQAMNMRTQRQFLDMLAQAGLK